MKEQAVSNNRLCPDRAVLKDYHLGKFGLHDLDAIAEHIDRCPDCQTTVVMLDDATDGLMAELRQAAAPSVFQEDPSVDRLLEIIKPSRSGPPAVEPPVDAPATAAADPASAPSNGRDAIGPPIAEFPNQLGAYRLLEKLGQGGMGAVYKAEHTKLGKIVALKVLSPDRMISPEAVARFKREWKAVGKLQHHNIVEAFDAGEVGQVHFLAMKFIAGPDLTKLVNSHGPLRYQDACEIVRQAALGLHHAHQHEMIHRDVKPSNLILDLSGEVKILDLGLALLTEEAADEDEVTRTGQVLGTYDYMAPEQVGHSHSVDRRVDIYGLGATLFKLLTGRSPFSHSSFRTTPQKLAAIITSPPPSLDQYRTDAPQRLSETLDRMLAREPDERFASALDVANALRDLADGSDLSSLLHSPPPPVPADTPSTVNTADWVDNAEPKELGAGLRSETAIPVDTNAGRRADSLAAKPTPTRPHHRSFWPIAAAVGALIVLVAGTLAAVSLSDRLSAVFSIPEPEPEPGPHGKDQKHGQGGRWPIDTSSFRSSPNALILVIGNEIDGIDRFTIDTAEPRGNVNAVASSPVEALVATGGHDGVVRVWDAKTQQLRRALVGHAGAVRVLGWSKNGATLASADQSGLVRFWDAGTGRAEGGVKPGRSGIYALAWSPTDPGAVAFADGKGNLFVWDNTAKRALNRFTVKATFFWSLSWSPDGKRVAAAGNDGDLRTWNVESGASRSIAGVHEGAPHGVAWSPNDANLLASSGQDGRLRVWNLKSARVENSIDVNEPCTQRALAWSRDGTMIAAGTTRGKLILWEPGNEPIVRSNHPRMVADLDWSGDEKRLISCAGNQVHWTNVESGAIDGAIHGFDQVASESPVFARSPTDDLLAVADGGWLSLWKTATGERSGRFQEHPSIIHDVAWSPTGKLLATAHLNKAVVVWQIDEKKPLHELTVSGGNNRLAWSRDGKHLAAAGHDGELYIWDIESGGEKPQEYSITAHSSLVGAIAWSPQANRLATLGSGEDQRIRIWDNDRREFVKTIDSKDESLERLVAWSPDGESLVALHGGPGATRTLRIWDVERAALIAGADAGFTYDVDWFAAEKTSWLVTAHPDNTAKLWNVKPKLTQQMTFSGHWGAVTRAEFSRSGKSVITSSQDGTIRFWDRETGRRRSLLLPIGEGGAVFGRGGRFAASPASLGARFVVVALTDEGIQETMTTDEFSERFGWENPWLFAE